MKGTEWFRPLPEKRKKGKTHLPKKQTRTTPVSVATPSVPRSFLFFLRVLQRFLRRLPSLEAHLTISETSSRSYRISYRRTNTHVICLFDRNEPPPSKRVSTLPGKTAYFSHKQWKRQTMVTQNTQTIPQSTPKTTETRKKDAKNTLP